MYIRIYTHKYTLIGFANIILSSLTTRCESIVSTFKKKKTSFYGHGELLQQQHQQHQQQPTGSRRWRRREKQLVYKVISTSEDCDRENAYILLYSLIGMLGIFFFFFRARHKTRKAFFLLKTDFLLLLLLKISNYD